MRLEPNKLDAYNGLGLNLNEQKKFAKAQAVFLEAFRAIPTAAADPASWLRYNAACSAALAAAEKDAEAVAVMQGHAKGLIGVLLGIASLIVWGLVWYFFFLQPGK
jgi:tetratricopeptide (TPR) repeat protein